MTGPLAGTGVSGSGAFCAFSKGPMTNMAASTQANGFFGAFLRFQALTVSSSRANAAVSGWSQFTDCLDVCHFCIRNPSATVECVEAVTGWEMDLKDAMTVGRRAMNQLRVFNLRHGLKRETERPSTRYGSTPLDGPVKGKGIMPVWDEMVENYYDHMGWDPKTGKPFPETLRSLGLDHLIQDL